MLKSKHDTAPPTTSKKSKRKSSNSENVPEFTSTHGYIVKMSETPLPPQLWCSTKIKLNTHIEISKFQSRPLPIMDQSDTRFQSKQQRQHRVNNLKLKTGNCKEKKRDFLNSDSLNDLRIKKCGCKTYEIDDMFCVNCKELSSHICKESMKWFCGNIKGHDI